VSDLDDLAERADSLAARRGRVVNIERDVALALLEAAMKLAIETRLVNKDLAELVEHANALEAQVREMLTKGGTWAEPSTAPEDRR
jgi:hypothetical protein